jgi:hypothetical protein
MNISEWLPNRKLVKVTLHEKKPFMLTKHANCVDTIKMKGAVDQKIIAKIG